MCLLSVVLLPVDDSDIKIAPPLDDLIVNLDNIVDDLLDSAVLWRKLDDDPDYFKVRDEDIIDEVINYDWGYNDISILGHTHKAIVLILKASMLKASFFISSRMCLEQISEAKFCNTFNRQAVLKFAWS